MRFSVALIAGLIAAQSFAVAGAQQNSDWLRASSLSEDTSEIRNAVQIQKASLKWNGEVISEDQFKILLRTLANRISPQPLLVLSSDEEVSLGKVARIKAMIDQQLDCNPSICLELSSSSN